MLPLMAAPTLISSVARNWRLFLILILFGLIGFGGWYYSSQVTNLKVDIFKIEGQLAISENNETVLRENISNVYDDLEELEVSNKYLEDAVNKSKISIADLISNPKVVIIKEPPIECNKKLEWLKIETLRLKERTQ